MNTLDLIILGFLGGGIVIGIRSGLIKQVLGFVGLLLAFLLGYQLMEPAGALVRDSLGLSPDIAPLLGFALVFLAVQVLVFAAVRMIEALVGVLRLSSVNRLLGGAVGAAKAALVLSVAFVVLAGMHVPSEDTRKESRLYMPVASVLPEAWAYAEALFPQLESLADRFGEGVAERLPMNGETN